MNSKIKEALILLQCLKKLAIKNFNFALCNKSEDGPQNNMIIYIIIINPHAPDRFKTSRARCAENCGSALTHR